MLVFHIGQWNAFEILKMTMDREVYILETFALCERTALMSEFVFLQIITQNNSLQNISGMFLAIFRSLTTWYWESLKPI